MTFPLVVNNDNALEDVGTVCQWLAAEKQLLKNQLETIGALLFRGFPIRNADDFDAFSAAFGYSDFTYEESLSNAVRINKTPRVFTANEAPPEIEITLHHEMAQTPIFPQKIFFFCESAAEEGGATPLCRSDLLWAALQSSAPDWAQKFADHGVKYTTHMPATHDLASGQGRSWSSTLSVKTRAEAETRLATLGYSWQWQTDGSLLTTTPALPAVRKLSDGSQSFFNQTIAAYLGWQRRDDSNEPILTLGNGEVIPAEVFSQLIKLAAEQTIPINWQDGDVALVDNYRVMHGRYPYGGSRARKVFVCLAND